jgi:hypothetical protein
MSIVFAALKARRAIVLALALVVGLVAVPFSSARAEYPERRSLSSPASRPAAVPISPRA